MKNKKGKEEKEGHGKKITTADCVLESKSDGDLLLAIMSLATTSGNGLGDDWILDSGCT